MAVITARKLRAYLKANRQSRAPVEAYVHPLVAQRLVNEDSSPIDMLKKVFRRHISVVVNDKLHLEDVEIVTTAPPKKRFFF